MDSERVKKSIDRIEAEFKKLAKVTGVTHISANLINGCFSIDDYENLYNPKFSEFRTGGKQ